MSELFAVLGHPIGHSLSPVIHTAAFRARGIDAVYEAIEVPAPEFMAALERLMERGVRGANLTAPLKHLGLFCADDQTDEAMDSGAANTLRFEDDRLIAHNTDGIGFVRFLERSGARPLGLKVVFLGAGGAAAGLTDALLKAGVEAITAIARDPEQASATLARATSDPVWFVEWNSGDAVRAVAAADLVIQATPLGLGAEDALPCPPEWVGEDALAVDLLYHPAESPWLRALRARGVRAANGIGLLVEQALFAQAFWFGDEPPREALEEALPWKDPFSAPGEPGAGPLNWRGSP